MAGCLKGQLYNALVLVWCSQVEDREDVLPTWANICRLGINHLSDTTHNHVSDGGRPGKMDRKKEDKGWWRGVNTTSERSIKEEVDREVENEMESSKSESTQNNNNNFFIYVN